MKRLFSLIFIFILFFPFFVFAKEREPEIEYPTIPGVEFPTVFSPPEMALAKYTKYIFNLGILVGIILAFFFLVFAGLRYTLSMENPEVKADARDQINKAFLGIIILLVSYHVLALISPELVIVEPVTLDRVKLIINFFRRPPRVRNVEELLTKLYPSAITLEVRYPEIKGFRPTIIPFVTNLPHYPLNLLIEQYIRFLYNWAIIIGVILAFLMLILNTVKIVFASGNPALITEAKGGISSAFLGLLLLLGSFYILKAFRPEYVLIKPAELPDIEIEIPEGVYFCQDRAPLRLKEDKDLFEAYIENQFLKKMGEKPKYLLDKKLLAELSLWIDMSCYRVVNSQNLPIEITGGEEQIDTRELNKIISQIPGLTRQEMEELLREIQEEARKPIQYPRAFHIYINGEYGIILHEKRDGKGMGTIFFSAKAYRYLSHDQFYPIDNKDREGIAPYQTLGWVKFTPKSVTVFKDLVLECYIKSKGNRLSYTDVGPPLGECLGWRDKPEPGRKVGRFNYEAVTFQIFQAPDFGGLEESILGKKGKITFLFYHLYKEALTTIYPQLVPISIIGLNGGRVKKVDPFFSFKFPGHSPWFAVVGVTDSMPHYLMYVFDEDERDFGGTYVRSFCNDRPCITGIFVWPGVILKPVQ